MHVNPQHDGGEGRVLVDGTRIETADVAPPFSLNDSAASTKQRSNYDAHGKSQTDGATAVMFDPQLSRS